VSMPNHVNIKFRRIVTTRRNQRGPGSLDRRETEWPNLTDSPNPLHAGTQPGRCAILRSAAKKTVRQPGALKGKNESEGRGLPRFIFRKGKMGIYGDDVMEWLACFVQEWIRDGIMKLRPVRLGRIGFGSWIGAVRLRLNLLVAKESGVSLPCRDAASLSWLEKRWVPWSLGCGREDWCEPLRASQFSLGLVRVLYGGLARGM
jgi:hypothetical protein